MTAHECPQRRPALVDVREAVRRFLQEVVPAASRVDVTKIVALASEGPAWEAEAVVWRPNATVASLGLATRRPVLDEVPYLVRLDGGLEVTCYEIKEAENVS
jgi:hypothetical protein